MRRLGIEFNSSADKTARDNQQNFAKISRCVDRACLLCYLIHTVFIARTKGGVALGFDIQTEAIPFPILAAPSLASPRYMPSLSFVHEKPVCPCLSIEMMPSSALSIPVLCERLCKILRQATLNQCCGCPCLARITSILPQSPFALKFARSHLSLKFCRASQSLRLVCAPPGWKRGRASVREA